MKAMTTMPKTALITGITGQDGAYLGSLRDLCGLTGWGASAGLPDVVVET